MENKSLYLFPELKDYDLEMLKAYGLTFLGKNYGSDGKEENWVVTGQESQLKRYAQNWLGYELHPDYFYEDEADFAGEVEEIVNESKPLKEANKIAVGNEKYKGYMIRQDHKYGGYNVYDKNNEMEDSGFKSIDQAKKFIDSLNESVEDKYVIYKQIKESFNDEANDDDPDDIQTYFYDDDAWEDSSVSARKDFIEDGKEFTWVKRHGDVEHLDFDDWAVWEAYCHDDAETYYFVVDEDTGFIDWGPVDTLEEAQEFLASKVSDWEDMDESYKSNTMKSELTEALKVNQGDLVEFKEFGTYFVCDTDPGLDNCYRITSDRKQRMNKRAPGGWMDADLAIRVIERAADHLDEGVELTESTLYVNQGDLVDFGSYGKLYVCNPNYHDDYYWVTDEEESRMNKNASGWSIEKNLAERVIESAFDDEDYDDEEYNESYVDNASEENSINLSDAINDSIVVFTDDINSITGDWVASQYKSDDDDILEAAETEDKINSPKIIVSRQDLGKVIDNLKSEPIKVVRRKKNKKFMSDYAITDSDIKSILSQLEAKDYSYSKISTNELYAGDVLTVFITGKQFTLSDKTLDGLTIYIKVDDSDEGLVTVVSIHEAEHQDNLHPYDESKSVKEAWEPKFDESKWSKKTSIYGNL